MIYTLGHSTRPIESVIEILKQYKIVQVADVRTLPYSKHVPQFNKEQLAEVLELAGMRYIHMKELGGFRHPNKDSVNLGWRNASFRGYADYMQTTEFSKGIERLIEIMKERTSALLCSEAVPWRCHRSLIADALTIRSINVVHIISKTSFIEHKLTSFARVRDKIITYPKLEDREN